MLKIVKKYPNLPLNEKFDVLAKYLEINELKDKSKLKSPEDTKSQGKT